MCSSCRLLPRCGTVEAVPNGQGDQGETEKDMGSFNELLVVLVRGFHHGPAVRLGLPMGIAVGFVSIFTPIVIGVA